MTRFTLHVPERYNDGTAVGEIVLDEIERLLVNIGGGFTRTTGRGAWRSDDGTVFSEPMRLYAVDSDDPDVPGKLHQLATKVADALRQEAVYLTHQSIGTELITAVPA